MGLLFACFSERQKLGVPDSGAKNRERSFAKGLKREERSCQQRGVKTAQRSRWMVWIKVRKIW